MEKADILEMTTNFLYMLNQQRSGSGAGTHKYSTPSHTVTRLPTATPGTSTKGEGCTTSSMGEYLKGFSTCQADVTSYLQNYSVHQSTPCTTRAFPAIVSPPPMTSPPRPGYGAFMTSTPYGNMNLVSKSAFRRPEATSTCTKPTEKDVNSNQTDFCVTTTSQDHVAQPSKRRRSDSDIHLHLDSFSSDVSTSHSYNTSHDFSSKSEDSFSKDLLASSSKKNSEVNMNISQAKMQPSSTSCTSGDMWRPW